MKTISKIIIGILPLIITACSTPKTENLKGISELNNKVSKVRFDYIDNNQDSKLSEQEFLTYEKDKHQFQETSRTNALIESCDSNGDKQISLDEVPEQYVDVPVIYEESVIPHTRCFMTKHHFRFKDINKDDILTFDELIAKQPITVMPYPIARDSKEEMFKYLKKKYKKCDENNDDKLSKKEATSTSCHMPSNHFTEADTNNDGYLTLQEVLDMATKKYEERPQAQPVPSQVPKNAPKEVRLMMSMQRCDTNKDRKISEAELTTENCGFTKEEFIKVDYNKDGYFSQEDMATFNLLRNFRRLDSNQDGFLSFEEFKKSSRVYY